MLVVTIDLWPHGSMPRKSTLAAVAIANDGTGTKELGNYDASVKDGDNKIVSVRIEGFDRSHGSVELLRQVLNAAAKQIGK